MVTVLLAHCPALWAHMGIQHWGSREGHPPQRDGVSLHDCALTLSPSSSIPSVGAQQGKKKTFPDRGPLQQPGSIGIWPHLPPLLQLKKKERAIWKLDMVCKWNPTCKQLRMWVMCDTQPYICTWFAQWIPVIFRGWNKTPVQQAPQLSESEIFSRVLQSGFPSDGNVSHSNSPAPLFQMLSLFSAPVSHGWR